MAPFDPEFDWPVSKVPKSRSVGIRYTMLAMLVALLVVIAWGNELLDLALLFVGLMFSGVAIIGVAMIPCCLGYGLFALFDRSVAARRRVMSRWPDEDQLG